MLGDSIYRYCSSQDSGSSVVFDGDTYTPLPIEAEGFDRNSKGAYPQPTLRIADVSGVIGSMMNSLNDLLGAKFTRIVTFKKYLDGEVGADPTAQFPKEIYWVERKGNKNRYMVELILASITDNQGMKLPKRVILKDVCTYVYRVWTGSSFDYTGGGTYNQCPYAGTSYFDTSGAVVAQSLDECGQRFSDCILRYPQPNPVPFRGFPGVLNTRI